jgi:SAM-dependent methyltransferase
LDVGCGYGDFLELASRKGWRSSGVELVPDAVKAASERIGNHKVFQCTLKDRRFPENTFDAVTLWDVLILTEDPYEDLRECYRILKEGGVLGIRLRNLYFQRIVYRLHSFLDRVISPLWTKRPYVFHRNCFHAKSIELLLRRLGFTSIKIMNSPLTVGDPYGHSSVSGVTQAFKRIMSIFSNLVFWASQGNWVAAPSILVWAEKPQ